MRHPYFVPAESQDKSDREEKDIKEILRDSDERARELFERRQPSPPSTFKETRKPAKKTDKD